MTAEAMQALKQELIAWELREARIYGEPMTPKAAAAKVEAGLASMQVNRALAELQRNEEPR